MPQHQADAPLVVDEIDHRFGEGFMQTAVGDVPHFGDAVLRTAGYDVVVVGTEGDVQDGALVTADQWMVGRDSAHLKIRLIN